MFFLWEKKSDIDCLSYKTEAEVIACFKKNEVIYQTKNIIKIKKQNRIQSYVRDRKNRYELVQDSQEMDQRNKKIAILYIATGRYIVFWDQFYPAMEKYFLPNHQKTYFLFTNHADLDVPENVIKVNIKHQKWPYATMNRYHFFLSVAEQLKKFDYIYFLNGNLIPVTEITEEIFPSKEQGVMVTIHPGFLRTLPDKATYDRNPLSQAYIPLGG